MGTRRRGSLARDEECVDGLSGWRRFSYADLQMLRGPEHPRRYVASPAELDTGREIPLSKICNHYVCDSSAAGPDVAAYTGLRISIKGSCGRPAGSAADLGRKRVSRPQSISLCIYEGCHAAQHLPCSRPLIFTCET